MVYMCKDCGIMRRPIAMRLNLGECAESMRKVERYVFVGFSLVIEL